MVEFVCEELTDTSTGLTGGQIGRLLVKLGVLDIDPTKHEVAPPQDRPARPPAASASRELHRPVHHRGDVASAAIQEPSLRQNLQDGPTERLSLLGLKALDDGRAAKAAQTATTVDKAGSDRRAATDRAHPPEYPSRGPPVLRGGVGPQIDLPRRVRGNETATKHARPVLDVVSSQLTMGQPSLGSSRAISSGLGVPRQKPASVRVSSLGPLPSNEISVSGRPRSVYRMSTHVGMEVEMHARRWRTTLICSALFSALVTSCGDTSPHVATAAPPAHASDIKPVPPIAGGMEAPPEAGAPAPQPTVGGPAPSDVGAPAPQSSTLGAPADKDRKSPPAPPQEGGPSAPEPGTEPGLTADQAAAFFADCEKGISNWRAGQVDYPARLSLTMGQSAAYVAAIDIRDKPLPAEKLVPGATPQSTPIQVQCVLSARLVPVGQSLEVDNKEWIPREFTPVGLLNWSWVVTAQAPGDQELRLELEPAVTTEGRYIQFQADNYPNVGTFITQVHVNASLIQGAGRWWKDNWGIVSLVAVAIGAALISIAKWGGNLGEAVLGASAKWRGEQKEES